MRAAVINEHGGLEKINVDLEYPKPSPEKNEVLIKVAATSLNYHDIFSRRGMPGIKIPMPLISGSDIAGTIEALGEDVAGWSEGDRVLVDPLILAGGKMGIIGEIAPGGKAEYTVAHSSQLIQIPDGVSFDEAAALPLAYGTAHRMMMTIGQVSEGETVLVLGASGGVGVGCVQLAKMVGAKVIACASSEGKITRLKDLGADYCVNYKEIDFREGVAQITGKPRITGEGGVDVAVNFTGGDTWAPTLRCVRKGGRILTCGATAGFEVTTDLRFIWTFEQKICGSNGWLREDLLKLLELVRDGMLMPVIDKVYPLEETAEAERQLEDRLVFGKVLVKP